jgi:hypothetical protein
MTTASTSHCQVHQPKPIGPRLGQFAVLALLLLLPALPWAGHGQVIRDDFNDGNSDGWTEYDPLSALGMGNFASFNVISNAYRIQAFPSPNPAAVGPGRAGAYREDAYYTNFYVAVDVLKFVRTGRPNFGLLARVRSPALGQTTGYSFTYDGNSNPSSSGVDLTRITGEDPTDIPTGLSDVYLETNKTYRFVFIGSGINLEGRVYELPNVVTPLLTVTGSDPTYTFGWVGLVVYDDTSAKNGSVDVTFDNFLAAPVEPPLLTIFRNQFGDITLTWPTSAVGFELQESLAVSGGQWVTIPPSEYTASGDRYVFIPLETAGNHFYRLYYR